MVQDVSHFFIIIYATGVSGRMEIFMKEITIKNILTVLHSNMENIEVTIEQLDDDLVEFGVDSIEFIRIVVSLEEEFECEIPDSKLLISEMNTINKIYEVLTSIERDDNFEFKDNNRKSE